jgi:hypothetical protein
MRTVENYLSQIGLSRKDRNNLRFYIALALARICLGTQYIKKYDFAKLVEIHASKQQLQEAYDLCWKEYIALGGGDDVARGSQLTDAVSNAVNLKLGKS